MRTIISQRLLKLYLANPSFFLYSSTMLISYLNITEQQLDKLERLLNFCIRYIFGLRKYDYVSEFRKLLKWLPIRLRRNSHILSIFYTIFFNTFTPPCLKERFVFLGNTHLRSLRSSVRQATIFYEKYFKVQADRLWNSLRISIRRGQTLTKFKNMFKDHYSLLSVAIHV